VLENDINQELINWHIDVIDNDSGKIQRYVFEWDMTGPDYYDSIIMGNLPRNATIQFRNPQDTGIKTNIVGRITVSIPENATAQTQWIHGQGWTDGFNLGNYFEGGALTMPELRD